MYCTAWNDISAFCSRLSSSCVHRKKLQIAYLKFILISSIMWFCAPSCVHVFVCWGSLNFVDTHTVIGLPNFFTKKSLHHILGKQDCIVVRGSVHHTNRKWRLSRDSTLSYGNCTCENTCTSAVVICNFVFEVCFR